MPYNRIKIVKWVCDECGSNNMSYKSSTYQCMVCQKIRTSESITFVNEKAIDGQINVISNDDGDSGSSSKLSFPHQIKNWICFFIVLCVLIITVGFILVNGEFDFLLKPTNVLPGLTNDLYEDDPPPPNIEDTDQGVPSNDSISEDVNQGLPQNDSIYEDLIVDPGSTYTVRFGGYIYSIMEENDAYIMYYTSPGETLEIDERLENYWYKVTFYLSGEGIAYQGYIKIQ